MDKNTEVNNKQIEIDYLDEDQPIPGQKFICLSILDPTSFKTEKEFNVRGVKVRGVYDTYEEAVKRAEKIRKFDSIFNVYIGEVGKWLALADNPELAKEEEYPNTELNKLMKSYKEDQEKAKEHHTERKNLMVKQAIDETEKKKKEKKREEGIVDEPNKDLETNLDEQKNELLNAKKILDEKTESMYKLKMQMDKLQQDMMKKKEKELVTDI
jgi:hypothetical protein